MASVACHEGPQGGGKSKERTVEDARGERVAASAKPGLRMESSIHDRLQVSLLPRVAARGTRVAIGLAEIAVQDGSIHSYSTRTSR